MKSRLYPEIVEAIGSFDTSGISQERKETLKKLVDFIQSKKDAEQIINLNFICTHNSRRSHLSQVWAQTMAAYFNLTNLICFSGGTEATALFPTVIESLQKTGFRISKLSDGDNPIYAIKYGDNEHPIMGFSKTFDADFNPPSNFAAVMTCSHADENCPFIVGAEQRIPITYEDPKAFDDTPQQTEKYQERSVQIATEMKYVFSKINQLQ